MMIREAFTVLGRFFFHLWTSILTFFGGSFSSPNTDMLHQFRGTLRTNCSAIPKTGLPAHLGDLRTQLEAILGRTDAKFSWNDAYQAEKLLAHLRSKASLDIEITKQISSLSETRPKLAEDYRAEYLAIKEHERDRSAQTPPPTKTSSKSPEQNDSWFSWGNELVDAKRFLLERLLNDVHWRYSQRFHNRGIANQYTRRIFGYNLILAIAFLIALVATPFFHSVAKDFPFAGFHIALAAGLLGSSFSVLTGGSLSIDRLSIEEVLRRTGHSVILLRFGIGGVASVILYFFFEADLVTGTLFPELQQIGFASLVQSEPALIEARKAFVEISEQAVTNLASDAASNAVLTVTEAKIQEIVSLASEQIIAINEVTANDQDNLLGAHVPNADLSKLMIWSFLAGFSEKLVPGLLNRVDNNSTSKTPS